MIKQNIFVFFLYFFVGYLKSFALFIVVVIVVVSGVGRHWDEKIVSSIVYIVLNRHK